MSTFELLAEQISSADSDAEIRIEAAIQLSNNIEHYVSGPTYAGFLRKLVPIFINCLKGPPLFIPTSLEQKLRICILTILYQLPKNSPGPFELYTEDVADLLINLVRMDNEENASLCIKIIIDIMRYRTKVLGDKLQPFLALIDHMFDQINLVVRDQLDNQAPYNSTPGTSLPESSQNHDNSPRSGSSTASISDIHLEQPTLPLPKAMASLKVLGECSILVQSIFEFYQSSDSLDIKLIFLRIKSILLLQAKLQEQAHAAAAAMGSIFTGDYKLSCMSASNQISGDMEAVQDTWYTAAINTVHIMHSLCKFKGIEKWMNEKDIIIWFKIVGKNPEAYLRANTLSLQLRLAAEQASEQLMVVFTKFLEHHPTDLDTLFSLVESVANGKFSQTHPLFTYIYHYIICNESIEYQKKIVLRSLEVYASKRASQRTKTFLLHNIVNPVVAKDVMLMPKEGSPKNPRLMDKVVIKSIHTNIWKVSFGDPNDDLTGIDHTRLEALQLTATLVKYHHSTLQDARKDIMKFGWAHIYLEDVINKHAAYVVISYFIAHYETPANLVQQVYLSLLKTNPGDGRALVTQALELIATVFPNMCNAVPDDRNPIWAVTPHRILTEERRHVPQITTVLSFLVKHADLFYECRDKFIILIVGSLRAIAQLPNCSGQSKKLVLQLMTLVWQWEQQRVEGKKPLTKEKSKLENSGEQLMTSSILSMIRSTLADTSEYIIPAWACTKTLNYLVEFIVSLRRPVPPLSAGAKAANASHRPRLK
ncbi:hypothetical protein B0O99DRAFT_690168 [Bisporella sp. PMI_857]|nr:hypothetical protein B0O99DRAFT_690168 [Bisporella sp. PMI_857]